MTTPGMLTRDQVIDRLKARGWSIKPSTWSGYVTRNLAPKPAEHIGRTPRWRLSEIDAWDGPKIAKTDSTDDTETRIQ